MKHEKALSKAKMELMHPAGRSPRDSPVFYSSIIFALRYAWEAVGTASIDGKTMRIDPDFWMRITAAHRVFTLAHEAGHMAYHHFDLFKMFNRKVYKPYIEHGLFNEAGDHRINLDLKRAGYSLIPGVLCDERFDGMTTMGIYHILHDECDPLAYQLNIYANDIDTSQADIAPGDHKHHVTDIVDRAVNISRMSKENPGNIPGGILRTLQETLNPPLPFEIILANNMSAYAADNYSFAKPNMRFMPEILLPGICGERLCNIACFFDVSGSVTENQLNSYATGIRMMREQLQPEHITLIEFDTRLGEVRDITEHSDLSTIEFTGGGGTYIQPVLDWIQENKPEVTLIFSDGEFHMPEIDLDTDIIWIIDNNPDFTAPYGKVIHYEISTC